MVNNYTYLEIYLKDLDRQINLKEFEKYFKKPHQTIKRHLKFLIKSKILLENKRGKFLFYTLNKENALTFEYISICEKERLFKFLKKRLFKRLYVLISKNLMHNKILIFGSSVENESFNDIDLLILSEDKEIIKLLKEFEKTYSIKFHITQTQEKHLTKSFIEEIKKKHIILNKHDYFVDLLYKKEK